MAPEQQLKDVAIERERRRSRHGYATPADARAFLQMARQPQYTNRAGASTATATNPIATAYFRAAEEEAEISPEGTSVGARERAPHVDATDAVIELRAEAGHLRQGYGGQGVMRTLPDVLSR